MTIEEARHAKAVAVSIAVFAWNEQEIIASTLNSFFEQSLFAELARRGEVCEVVCVANGCSDRTPVIAQEVFDRQSSSHPHRAAFRCRVENLAQPGKLNAWNQFVHALSSTGARALFMADADITILPGTLWNMLRELEMDPEAYITVDRPRKDIAFKTKKSWRERLSLIASQTTQVAPAQLCAQLYCIRAEVARNIYLPRELSACEDGFIKALVCTDFLTHEVWPKRIRMAANAEHTFEAYCSAPEILKNQKRQIIGQTMVHLIVDKYLKNLPAAERQRVADTLRERESLDPSWLKRSIAEHLRGTRRFWRLYPGLLTHRFKRLAALSPAKRLISFPAALISLPITLIACAMAYQFLKSGSTQYWPQAKRTANRFNPASRTDAWALNTESAKLD
jgi:glycosyltransferase involved in cell wall biosynthesis